MIGIDWDQLGSIGIELGLIGIDKPSDGYISFFRGGPVQRWTTEEPKKKSSSGTSCACTPGRSSHPTSADQRSPSTPASRLVSSVSRAQRRFREPGRRRARVGAQGGWAQWHMLARATPSGRQQRGGSSGAPTENQPKTDRNQTHRSCRTRACRCCRRCASPPARPSRAALRTPRSQPPVSLSLALILRSLLRCLSCGSLSRMHRVGRSFGTYRDGVLTMAESQNTNHTAVGSDPRAQSTGDHHSCRRLHTKFSSMAPFVMLVPPS
eukprot:SAG31_NODE_2278_length_6027_cov_1.979588_5_plen_266_part_00